MSASSLRLLSAVRVIVAAWQQRGAKDPATAAAQALESAGLLMSPEKAAELDALRVRVAELEAAAYGDAEVRLLSPVEQVRHLHDCVAAQLSRADTLDRLCREQRARADAAETRVAELEAAPRTAFRASHDSIVMGLYTTAAEARKHCEAEERRSWATFEKPRFDWAEDEEDGVAEMTAWVGGEAAETGYEVTALEIASEYDEEADA